MPDQHEKGPQQPLSIEPETLGSERSTQARRETVLAQIEDATYAVLRKHEQKSA
jgi:hypothetical protein